MTKHGAERKSKIATEDACNVTVLLRHSSRGTISLIIVKLGRGWPGA